MTVNASPSTDSSQLPASGEGRNPPTQSELEQAQREIRNLKGALREKETQQHAMSEQHVEALTKQKIELEAYFSQLVSHDKCYEIAHSLEAQHQKLKEIYEQKLKDAQRYVVQRLEMQENDLSRTYEAKLENTRKMAEDSRQEHIRDTVKRLQAKEKSFAQERHAAAAKLEATEAAATQLKDANAAIGNALEEAKRTTDERTRELGKVKQTVTDLVASLNKSHQERDNLSQEVSQARKAGDAEMGNRIALPISQSEPAQSTTNNYEPSRPGESSRNSHLQDKRVASDTEIPVNNKAADRDMSTNNGVSLTDERTREFAQHIIELNHELDDLRSKNSELLQSISRHETQHKVLDQELQNEKRVFNDMKCYSMAQKETLQRRLEAREKEVVEEQESSNKALQAAHGQIHQLQTELSNRESASSENTAHQTAQQNSLQLEHVKAQMNLAQEELQITLDSLADKEKEIEFVEDCWAEDKDEIEALHSQLKSLNTDLASSRKAIEELQRNSLRDADEQESRQKEVKAMTHQLAGQKKAFDQLERRYVEETGRLKDELDTIQAVIDDGRPQGKSNSSGRNAPLHDEIDDLTRRREHALANEAMSTPEKDRELEDIRSSLRSMREKHLLQGVRLDQLRRDLSLNEPSSNAEGDRDPVGSGGRSLERERGDVRDGTSAKDPEVAREDANLALFKDNSNLKWAEAVVHLVRIRYTLENELNAKDKVLDSQHEKISHLKKKLNNQDNTGKSSNSKASSPRPNDTERKQQGTPVCSEPKRKDDEYFLQQFAKLSLMIAQFSKEHFLFVPTDPPTDVLAGLPNGLPSFFDNTLTAYELRCTYIQHIVYKHLTSRIFKPFLFTLGRHHDNGNRLLESIDSDIHRKSIRREVFWRQQTLLALFTGRDAKHAMNHVIINLTEEITDAVRRFADHSRVSTDVLREDVRSIVKHAAKTWRQARLQQQLILAVMPSVDDERAVNHVWAEFDYEGEIGSNTARESRGRTNSGENKARQLLLRVAPRIWREPAHPDHLAEMPPDASDRLGEVCIYQPGSLIYADSSIITARLQELSDANSVGADSHGLARCNGDDDNDDYGDDDVDNQTMQSATVVASQLT